MNHRQLSVLTLVGPKDDEVRRLGHLLASLAVHESVLREIVLVDDAPVPRPLADVCPALPGVKITTLGHELAGRSRRGGDSSIQGAVCVGLLQALSHVAQSAPGGAVIKLDTDALVIAPFADRLGELLAREPDLGTAGVVEWNCDGSRRVWEPFPNIMRHLARPFILKHPLLSRRVALWGDWGRIRRLLRTARRQGYAWGEHAQGGCYLVSGKLLERMAGRGYFDQRRIWLHSGLSEDVMIGLYARACGLKNIHFGRAGEVFGSAHQGLPLAPEELVKGGYALIHSIKNDPRASEEELYRFFQAARLPGVVSAEFAR